MENERRRAIRIKKPLLVHYSKDGKVWDISPVRDFSETGMQFTINGKLEVGRILKFSILIPLKPVERLEFSGKVIDSVELKTRYGASVPDMYITRIELMDMHDEQKALLRRYIAWVLKHDATMSKLGFK